MQKIVLQKSPSSEAKNIRKLVKHIDKIIIGKRNLRCNSHLYRIFLLIAE